MGKKQRRRLAAAASIAALALAGMAAAAALCIMGAGARESEMVESTLEVIGDFYDISLDEPDAKISFSASGDGACRVECLSPEGVTHSAAIEDGTLYIRASDARGRRGRAFGPSGGDAGSVVVFLP